jgi:hypothetical protein
MRRARPKLSHGVALTGGSKPLTGLALGVSRLVGLVRE